MDEKEKDNVIMYGLVLLAFALFLIGLVKVHEMGFVSGLETICEPLSVGVDSYDGYVCFNDTQPLNNDYFSFGGVP